MHTLQALEREALGGAGRDVDQEPRPAPALVLLGVDVERRAADLAESHVVGSGRQLAVLQADRRAAVAAAAGLEERERPVGGLEAIGSPRAPPGVAVTGLERGRSPQKNPSGLGS